MLLSCLATPALAQLSLQQTPESIKVLLSTQNKEHKMVLNDQGNALEVPVSFPLIARESVAVEAPLGYPGRFDIELVSPKALVEIKNLRVEDSIGRAEIVRKVPLMSPEELRQQRDGRAKPLEGKPNLLRQKLDEAAEANPRRFSTQEKNSWEAMKPGELYNYYRLILETEIAEQHLIRCGLDFDRSTRNAAEKVVPMFTAMYVLMTGQAPTEPKDAKAARDAMTGGSMILMKQALTVDLRFRVYSNTDDADANSQWFNAQRVACRAIGVGIIRVEGTLDPAAGDRVDWWLLDRWDPGAISFTNSADGDVQFDAPQVVNGTARLRIAAGKKAARYWFELRPEKGGDLKVVIHESPIPAAVKFPY